MEGDKRGKVPPKAPPPPDSKEAEESVDHANDHAGMVTDVSKTYAKQISSIRKMSLTDGERVEVDRTALEAILDVGSRSTGIQKKNRLSMSTLAYESHKDKPVNKFNN